MQPPRNIDWKSTSIRFICGEKNGRVRPGALDVNRAVYRRLRPAVHRLDRQKLGTSYSNTLTLEKSTAPGDAAAEDLFAGASLVPVERKSESVRPGMTQRKTTYPS